MRALLAAAPAAAAAAGAGAAAVPRLERRLGRVAVVGGGAGRAAAVAAPAPAGAPVGAPGPGARAGGARRRLGRPLLARAHAVRLPRRERGRAVVRAEPDHHERGAVAGARLAARHAQRAHGARARELRGAAALAAGAGAEAPC